MTRHAESPFKVSVVVDAMLAEIHPVKAIIMLTKCTVFVGGANTDLFIVLRLIPVETR